MSTFRDENGIQLWQTIEFFHYKTNAHHDALIRVKCIIAHGLSSIESGVTAIISTASRLAECSKIIQAYLKKIIDYCCQYKTHC